MFDRLWNEDGSRTTDKPRCAMCGCVINGYVWKDSGYTFCHPTCEGHGKTEDVVEVELLITSWTVPAFAPWYNIQRVAANEVLNLN